VVIIYAATNGYLDAVDVEQVRAYETGLYQFLDTRRAQLVASLSEKKQIDDQIKTDLNQTLKEFGDAFAAGRKSAAA
jgi:F-type H+/Na+-transporting ATPase subunit alpha